MKQIKLDGGTKTALRELEEKHSESRLYKKTYATAMTAAGIDQYNLVTGLKRWKDLTVEGFAKRIETIRQGLYYWDDKAVYITKTVPVQPSPDLFRNEPEDRAFLAKKWIRDKEKGFIFQIYGFQPDQEHWIKLEYDHYTSEIGLNEKREFINLATDETHPCDRSAMQVEWLR